MQSGGMCASARLGVQLGMDWKLGPEALVVTGKDLGTGQMELVL